MASLATTNDVQAKRFTTVLDDRGTSGAGTVTPDLTIGSYMKLTCSAATITIGNPTNGDAGGGFNLGQRLTVHIKNSSGGGLTITWGSAFLQAATAPASTKSRLFEFVWDGVKWTQAGVGLDV